MAIWVLVFWLNVRFFEGILITLGLFLALPWHAVEPETINNWWLVHTININSSCYTMFIPSEYYLIPDTWYRCMPKFGYRWKHCNRFGSISLILTQVNKGAQFVILLMTKCWKSSPLLVKNRIQIMGKSFDGRRNSVGIYLRKSGSPIKSKP